MKKAMLKVLALLNATLGITVTLTAEAPTMTNTNTSKAAPSTNAPVAQTGINALPIDCAGYGIAPLVLRGGKWEPACHCAKCSANRGADV